MMHPICMVDIIIWHILYGLWDMQMMFLQAVHISSFSQLLWYISLIRIEFLNITFFHSTGSFANIKKSCFSFLGTNCKWLLLFALLERGGQHFLTITKWEVNWSVLFVAAFALRLPPFISSPPPTPQISWEVHTVYFLELYSHPVDIEKKRRKKSKAKWYGDERAGNSEVQRGKERGDKF